jgi:hypothetical protein
MSLDRLNVTLGIFGQITCPMVILRATESRGFKLINLFKIRGMKWFDPMFTMLAAKT